MEFTVEANISINYCNKTLSYG